MGITVQLTGEPVRGRRLLTVSSISSSRSRPTASGLAKSNRRRSGSTLLPACWACLPRCVCRAWCSTWVAEWARRIACAARGVDLGRHVALDGDRALGHPADVEREVVLLLRVLDREDESRAADRADVADLPAALAVERRFGRESATIGEPAV